MSQLIAPTLAVQKPGPASDWPAVRWMPTVVTITASLALLVHGPILQFADYHAFADRLPIALGCAGLLASVRAGTRGGSACTAVALGVAAVASVLWWWITNGTGEGDLRPYLLLQGLPLVLIPLWQAIYGAPRSHRLAVGLAIGPLRRGEDGRIP